MREPSILFVLCHLKAPKSFPASGKIDNKNILPVYIIKALTKISNIFIHVKSEEIKDSLGKPYHFPLLISFFSSKNLERLQNDCFDKRKGFGWF